MDYILDFWKKSKPYMLVALLQVGYTVMNIISNIALNNGTSPRVLVVYRHVSATIFLAPLAFFGERKIRPKMTLSVFVKILLLALLEPAIDQNLYFVGMKLTTASFTTAMANMLPAFSFLLAWMLRLEKVNLRKVHSLAKILGTMVTVGGALIMTLVNGPALTNHHQNASTSSTSTSSQDPVKGAIMITIGCLCWAAFFNLQAITMKEYPAALSLATFICLAGSIESAIYAIPMERHDLSVWALRMDWKLLASVYSGVVCSAIAISVQGVIMKTKGPVFVTAFSPLSMVTVTIVSCLFLSEMLYLGRLIGAIVIVCGLYLVLWGKSKDPTPSPSTGVKNEIPLSDTKLVATNETENSRNPGLVSVDLARF